MVDVADVGRMLSPELVVCRDGGLDAFAHLDARADGERHAEHLLGRDAALQRGDDALRQHLGLAGSRRRQDEMAPFGNLNDSTLFLCEFHVPPFLCLANYTILHDVADPHFTFQECPRPRSASKVWRAQSRLCQNFRIRKTGKRLLARKRRHSTASIIGSQHAIDKPGIRLVQTRQRHGLVKALRKRDALCP